MPDEKKDKLTMPALIVTALIAIIGNTDKLSDKAAGATIVHGLIKQVQADLKAEHAARHALTAYFEQRQGEFEDHLEGRFDDLEADILIPDKEDHLPDEPAPRFEPPELKHAEPPPAPMAPPVNVDQLLD